MNGRGDAQSQQMPSPLAPLLILGAITRVAAHGMMSFPPPRNAVDRRFAPWNETVPAVRAALGR
jgi:hypothetical protein